MKSKVDMYVMNKVKERRLALSLSQLALANELEMSTGFIGQVESPKYPAKYNVQLQTPVKLTTLRRFKLTSVGRSKLTTSRRSKLTTC